MTLSLSSEPMTIAISGRGPLSAALLEVLTDRAPQRAGELAQLARDAVLVEDPITDEDVQLSLFLLYAVAYGSLPQFAAHWEWDVSLLAARAALERAFEDAVRAVVPQPERPEPTGESVAAALFALTAPQPGPSLSHHVARRADAAQARELLVQRSIYTLREADAHSWAIPRLTGRAKAALIEIQADEYGGGRVERMHQVMFADAMRGADLDDAYGAYVDLVPAITLASFNLMTMFGLNRRLIGASVGHLAAFEMTSSLPCRAIAEGLRRLGFGDDVAAYYDEHVEADAVHEQIAGRDLAGSLAEDRPELLDDILFGAAACLTVDGWASEHILHAWEAGRSSLRREAQLG
ncbi:iron-containing redox enzyme family protein [Microbacterium esteraromaticum]|uniref:Iron-containing redox enzyme family protein n=1 Tax=Microbacterium esteraromaticum TaxID=57043 RepID=A0A7D8AKT0_9MICO|nr:iron-containing redox enzyme family protein [Microbacterium esteraromaticum]QMU98285.1 iron-containing redox enzyme family protein [Microbacterium esteraromaticum]